MENTDHDRICDELYFAANVPWNKVQWKPLAVPKFTYGSASIARQPFDLVPGKWLDWDDNAPSFKIGTDGMLDHGLSEMPLYLKRSTDAHPLTFQVDDKEAGKFDIEILFAGKRGSKLEIRLDGRPMLTKDFPAGAKLYQFQSNGTYSIDVPVGQHAIQVANTSSDPAKWNGSMLR